MGTIAIVLILVIILICAVHLIDDVKVCLAGLIIVCTYILFTTRFEQYAGGFAYGTDWQEHEPKAGDAEKGIDTSDAADHFIRRGPDRLPFDTIASTPLGGKGGINPRDSCAPVDIAGPYEDSGLQSQTLDSGAFDAYDIDTGLANKQRYRAIMNKTAIDGAVRSTRNFYQKNFSNELDENERRVWYSEEASPVATDFWSYY